MHSKLTIGNNNFYLVTWYHMGKSGYLASAPQMLYDTGKKKGLGKTKNKLKINTYRNHKHKNK